MAYNSLYLTFGFWSFIIITFLMIIALFIHEFSKVVIANILTDDAVEVGVPIKKFIEPVGIIFMYAYGFGWANGPKINVSRFKNRKKGAIFVFGGAITSSILIGMIGMFISFKLGSTALEASQIMYAFGVISIAIGVMNIIPMYPFSGHNLFFETQSPNTRMWLMNNKGTVQFIALFFVFFGLFRPFIYVFINFFEGIVRLF